MQSIDKIEHLPEKNKAIILIRQGQILQVVKRPESFCQHESKTDKTKNNLSFIIQSICHFEIKPQMLPSQIIL